MRPHENVFVRIKRSEIHGVGVFAIVDIPTGTDVFGEDETETVLVPEEIVERLDGPHRMLYKDFAMLKEGAYVCPPSFNEMTAAWYLNHSKEPNVVCDDDFRFHTTRVIRAGEELTVDYNTYSEQGI